MRTVAFYLAGTFSMLLTLSANAVVIQLGDQDFADGVGVNSVAAFNAAAAGEPAPFDQFRGSDLVGRTPLSESWTFNFLAQAYPGATFTLGITDHDSQAPGSQVAFFGFDGNVLTSLLDTAFESSGGRQFENNIYTINVPNSALASLSDGTALFTLTLQGPSLGGGTPLTPNPSSLPNNGAGLDFARLDLAASVPEPTTLALMGIGLAGVGFARKRTKA